MVRCYSCHIKDASRKCLLCGQKICDKCSITLKHSNNNVCTGCVADMQRNNYEKRNKHIDDNITVAIS